MTTPTIAVTGSTGQLGGRIAQRLADRGVAQRLIVRDPARAPELPGASIVQADWTDRDALVAALDGIKTVFFVSGKEGPERLDVHKGMVDAFVAAGVERVVYTSFLGAAPDCEFTTGHDHYWTEQYMSEVGLPFAALRDNFYQDFMPLLVDDGVIKGPAGDGRFSPVARDDVADSAVALLLDEGRTGTFDMTGPEQLSLADVAAIVSETSGSAVEFVNETIEEAYASRAGYGAPQSAVDGWVTTYTAIALAELELLSDDVELLTGHKPQSLRETLSTE